MKENRIGLKRLSNDIKKDFDNNIYDLVEEKKISKTGKENIERVFEVNERDTEKIVRNYKC